MQRLLGFVDRSLSGLESFSSDSQETLRQEDLPVPRFMLDSHVDGPDYMDVDDPFDQPILSKPQQQAAHRHHTSDSGLGSSVTSAQESLSGDHAAADKLSREHNPLPSTNTGVRSGINGYAPSGVDASNRTHHALSEYACEQIQRYIIVPITKEPTLEAFHQLVKSIPYRVGQKQITCLRDLEKVILWLAPCLHTTVQHLNESDQRRPTDRPYTNGYFLDLTEQVRQYAAMITASRERATAGKEREEKGYTTYVCGTQDGEVIILNIISDEQLSLHGGLGRTGRPAELVRIKDGQAISLRSGEVVEPDKAMGPDDDLHYSMARRRKSEQAAAKQAQRCSECDKEFKRPCDLTKHEKTHSRPWKCNEPSCKYSQYGWPTEKERDRHVNDKHSMAPNMYKCQYDPCPYESKRESNCKQHMEKAHGWAYVRSKNNGKSGKKPSKVGKTPPTSQIATPSSYIFDASGSEYGGDSSSPYMRHYSGPPSANGSSGEGSSHLSNLESPYLGVNEPVTPYEPTFSWGDSYNRLTPQSYTPNSHRISMDSLTTAPTAPSSYEVEPLFGGTYDWSNLDLSSSNLDLTSMNIQLDTTSPLSIGTAPLHLYSRNPSISVEEPQSSKNPNLSPGAQGNQMLYSPYHNEVVDEGYGDFATNAGKPASDFALFDSRPSSSLGGNLFSDLPSLPAFQPTTWSGQGADLTQQLGMNEMMQLDEE
ncbi:MAG: copper-binding transcription factor [Alectoria sarmentosa]|nr:MAG: copper-binding transcription factor [Alectoria sarmentosa]